MKSLFDLFKTASPGLVPGLERFDFSKLPDARVLKNSLATRPAATCRTTRRALLITQLQPAE